ncbi:glutamyl-tRNA reductase [Furfurilactobacillus entadae]|uniref:glutamyl-tRNA reductase n=1 Tax=Furfurilactobacillus entadae TaxID=2922307 RepID=UPI0035EEDA2C
MYIMYASLNYRDLTVQERGQFTFSPAQLGQADRELKAEKSIFEDVILSTCNRTEIYAVVDQLHTGRYYLKRFLANWFNVEISAIEDVVNIGSETEAISHLMRVASGLDSMIAGEPQILGQLKAAFAVAQDVHTTGLIFNELFKEATTFAKRMHTEYRVSELSQSSSQAGLHEIKRHFGTLTGKKLLVVGAGMIGQQVARNASTMGFATVNVVNRTDETAHQVAASLSETVVAKPWAHRNQLLQEADAVVMAASVTEPLVTATMVTAAPVSTTGIVVDLGVPQNVAPEAVPVLNRYANVDDLATILTGNEQLKQQWLAAMEMQVPSAVNAFADWQRALPVVPIIRDLRESSLAIESNAYESLLRKLPELDKHERQVISKHMKSIVNQMIKEPIVHIKDASSAPNAAEHLDFFCEIFGFDRAVQLRKEMTHEK